MPLAAKIKVCFLVIFQNASSKFIKTILKKTRCKLYLNRRRRFSPFTNSGHSKRHEYEI